MSFRRADRLTVDGHFDARMPVATMRSRERPRARRVRLRAVSSGADRLLLPDARLGVRGRGRGAGGHGAGVAERRRLRRSLEREVVAVSHRDQRVHRHAPKRPAPGQADGHGPGVASGGVVSRAGAAGSDMGNSDSGRAASRRNPPIPPRLRSTGRRCGSRSSLRSNTCPARQRAALILCEVLRWQASETAELLDTSVAAVNSALQRARATLGDLSPDARAGDLDDADAELLERYVDAFERYDIERLVTLLHDDAVQSMPPFAMWIEGAADMATWMVQPGPSACRGSRLLPTVGQRLPRIRAIPTRPRRRLLAVGAADTRDLRRADHRHEVLPRVPGPRAPLPGVRPAAAPRVTRPDRAVPASQVKPRSPRAARRAALASRAKRATASTAPKSGDPEPSNTCSVTVVAVRSEPRSPGTSAATRSSCIGLREALDVIGGHRRVTDDLAPGCRRKR